MAEPTQHYNSMGTVNQHYPSRLHPTGAHGPVHGHAGHPASGCPQHSRPPRPAGPNYESCLAPRQGGCNTGVAPTVVNQFVNGRNSNGAYPYNAHIHHKNRIFPGGVTYQTTDVNSIAILAFSYRSANGEDLYPAHASFKIGEVLRLTIPNNPQQGFDYRIMSAEHCNAGVTYEVTPLNTLLGSTLPSKGQLYLYPQPNQGGILDAPTPTDGTNTFGTILVAENPVNVDNFQFYDTAIYSVFGTVTEISIQFAIDVLIGGAVAAFDLSIPVELPESTPILHGVVSEEFPDPPVLVDIVPVSSIVVNQKVRIFFNPLNAGPYRGSVYGKYVTSP